MEWNYNDLMTWDDTVGPIPNVVKLDISNNGLTELPMKIFKLVSLQQFSCDQNQLFHWFYIKVCLKLSNNT